MLDLSAQIIYEKNFLTEGKTFLVNGYYVLGYNFLASQDELSASNGYDVITAGNNPEDLSAQNVEYTTFQELTDAQKALFNFSFFGSASYPFSVVFPNVVDNLRFYVLSF